MSNSNVKSGGSQKDFLIKKTKQLSTTSAKKSNEGRVNCDRPLPYNCLLLQVVADLPPLVPTQFALYFRKMKYSGPVSIRRNCRQRFYCHKSFPFTELS